MITKNTSRMSKVKSTFPPGPTLTNHNVFALKVRKGIIGNHNETILKVRKGLGSNHNETVLQIRK